MALTGVKLATTIGGTTYTATNTNVETEYLYSPNQSSGSGNYTFQIDVTRTSGTLAGSVTLQGSLDGTDWVTPLETAVTLVDGASHIMTIATTKRFLFYRVAITTSGTVVASTEAYMLEDTVV